MGSQFFDYPGASPSEAAPPSSSTVAFRPTASFCCIRRERMGPGAVRHGPHRTPSPVSQAAWAWRGQHRARHRPETSTAWRSQSGAWHAVGGSTPVRPEPALRPGGPLVGAWLCRGRGPAGGPGGGLLDLERPATGLDGPGFLAASRPVPPRPAGGRRLPLPAGTGGARVVAAAPGGFASSRPCAPPAEVEAAPNGTWWVRQPGGAQAWRFATKLAAGRSARRPMATARPGGRGDRARRRRSSPRLRLRGAVGRGLRYRNDSGSGGAARGGGAPPPCGRAAGRQAPARCRAAASSGFRGAAPRRRPLPPVGPPPPPAPPGAGASARRCPEGAPSLRQPQA